MWFHLFEFTFLAYVIVVYSVAYKMLGKGRWLVENIAKCPNSEQYVLNFDLKKKKVNRTHDGFDIEMELAMDITYEEFGVYADICKKVDGGCKPFQVFVDDSFCKVVMKYAKDNIKKLLRGAGMEEDCPILKGHYQVNQYTFDYSELPEDGMYGDFTAVTYITKDNEKLGCAIVDLNFEAERDEDVSFN